MSGVSFEDATYPYDGKEKTLEITGQLPEGVTVSYENNTLTNAGSVRAKAEFTVADTEHYNEIDEVLYADLTITKATPTITIKPDQATLTDGSNTINLFQQNMFAVRAEIEVGFRCDTTVFNKLTNTAT